MRQRSQPSARGQLRRCSKKEFFCHFIDPQWALKPQSAGMETNDPTDIRDHVTLVAVSNR